MQANSNTHPRYGIVSMGMVMMVSESAEDSENILDFLFFLICLMTYNVFRIIILKMTGVFVELRQLAVLK